MYTYQAPPHGGTTPASSPPGGPTPPGVPPPAAAPRGASWETQHRRPPPPPPPRPPPPPHSSPPPFHLLPRPPSARARARVRAGRKCRRPSPVAVGRRATPPPAAGRLRPSVARHPSRRRGSGRSAPVLRGVGGMIGRINDDRGSPPPNDIYTIIPACPPWAHPRAAAQRQQTRGGEEGEEEGDRLGREPVQMAAAVPVPVPVPIIRALLLAHAGGGGRCCRRRRGRYGHGGWLALEMWAAAAVAVIYVCTALCTCPSVPYPLGWAGLPIPIVISAWFEERRVTVLGAWLERGRRLPLASVCVCGCVGAIHGCRSGSVSAQS